MRPAITGSQAARCPARLGVRVGLRAGLGEQRVERVLCRRGISELGEQPVEAGAGNLAHDAAQLADARRGGGAVGQPGQVPGRGGQGPAGAFDAGQAAQQRAGEVVRQCLRVVGGVPGQVVAEVVVADGDGIDLAGKVRVAQRVTCQVDGVLSVPGLVLNVG